MGAGTGLRRNIVLILCDQLRPDFLHAYGAHFIPTPNIDALAAHGTTFDNAITASTVCAPARASIMTGKFVSSHGAWTNGIPCKAGTVYLPQRLNAAGYMTAAVGEFDHAPLGNTIGYQYSRLFLDGRQGCQYTAYLKAKHPEATTPWMSDGLHFKYPEEDFYDRWSTDRAIDFMNSYTAAGKAPDGTAPETKGAPFFLYCGFNSPHGPLLPPREVSGKVDPAKLPTIRTTARDQDIPAVERNRRAFLNSHEALSAPQSVVPERMEERLAYAEMIVEIDALVGRIVKSLVDNGIYDNTSILFSSDHGSMEHDYNMSTKGPWPYKPQLFVPLIVSNDPRLKKGAHCDSLCGNLDIGATVLDIAGDHGAFGASRSLIGTAEGSIPEREVNMSEFCDSCKTLVDKRYTFTYYPFTGVTGLYDRVADPEETTNLAGNPELADVERTFLMHVIDFMVLAKGVRIESHDLVPVVHKGIEKKEPAFLEDFDIAYPLASMVEVERLKQAGLPWDYNEFCRTREIKAHYGVYYMKQSHAANNILLDEANEGDKERCMG